jgi:hypothetical protein
MVDTQTPIDPDTPIPDTKPEPQDRIEVRDIPDLPDAPVPWERSDKTLTAGDQTPPAPRHEEPVSPTDVRITDEDEQLTRGPDPLRDSDASRDGTIEERFVRPKPVA